MQKRILIAFVACLIVASFAAIASAATATEKDAAFQACLKSGPAKLMIGGPSRFEECCTKSGGKFDSEGGFSCSFTSDRVSPGDSVLSPYDPGIIVIRP